MFGIIHKNTKRFFGGFDSAGEALWTSEVEAAWKRADRLVAECQASALVMVGDDAQRKPVSL